MALLLKSCVKNGLCYSNSVRSLSTLHSGNSTDNRSSLTNDKQSSGLHMTAKVQYPQAQPIPLPNNINDDTAHFSPQRARDLTGPAILNHQSLNTNVNYKIDVTAEVDSHTQCYDCNGAVSLNSSMQSNVPSPFSGSGDHYMHLNMPGGQWEQWSKYVSNDLQCSHYTNLRQQIRSNDEKTKVA
uniref:Uncharacterized protein n=1 Tax=Xenopsylla cheopis TaxID=163159 RepID=A0A6M2DWF6_XENCH